VAVQITHAESPPLPCNIQKIYQIKSHAKKIIFKILFVFELKFFLSKPYFPKNLSLTRHSNPTAVLSLFFSSLRKRMHGDRGRYLVNLGEKCNLMIPW